MKILDDLTWEEVPGYPGHYRRRGRDRQMEAAWNKPVSAAEFARFASEISLWRG